MNRKKHYLCCLIFLIPVFSCSENLPASPEKPRKAESDWDKQVNLIRLYNSANSWTERLALIRKPGDYERYISENNLQYQKPVSYQIEETKTMNQKSIMGRDRDIFWILVDYPEQGLIAAESKWFGLVKTGSTWKFDWSASLMYNATNLRDFITNPASLPEKFRVSASLSDYFGYQYNECKNTHFSVLIADTSGIKCFGYTPKTSETGKILYKILRNGGSENVILRLRPNTQDGDSRFDPNLFDIESIVSDTAAEPVTP